MQFEDQLAKHLENPNIILKPNAAPLSSIAHSELPIPIQKTSTEYMKNYEDFCKKVDENPM